MNAVGAIGNFLINNQVMIEAVLLILLGGFFIYWLVQKFRGRTSQESQAVKELQEKIEELESKLKGMEEGEHAEVKETEDATRISIATELNEESVEEKIEELIIEERLIFEETAAEDLPDSLDETLDIRKLMLENEEFDGVMDAPLTRFGDLNWGQDKHGNVYTEEDLRNQIN